MSFARQIVLALFGAFQFLTVLPIHRNTVPPARAALFFPAVGAALGFVAAAVLQLLVITWGMPPLLASILTLGLTLHLAGMLHEDGLADVADAFRAGRSPEYIREILRDSRIGAYGVIALVVMIGIRWAALVQIAEFEPSAMVAALVSSMALSRAAMVLMGSLSNPLPSGLGSEFVGKISMPVLAFVGLQAGAAAYLPGLRVAPLLLGAMLVLLLILRWWFHRRLGAVNGDCLGATAVLTETLLLVLLACKSSI
jgi:adenosylcobinamide-GDP ribazoletransferase